MPVGVHVLRSKERALVRAGDDVGLVVQVSSHSSEPAICHDTQSAYTSKRVFASSASQMGWQLRPYSTPYVRRYTLVYTRRSSYIADAATIDTVHTARLRAYEA